MPLVPFDTRRLPTLMGWFPDAAACAIWAGPGMRFPFVAENFRHDLKLELPSFGLLDATGELIGFGQYYARAGHCHLARLAIAPAARGRGAGIVLVRGLAAIGSRALRTPECSLFVLESNTPARRLYERLGFEPASYPGEMPSLPGCLYLVAPTPKLCIDRAALVPRVATREDIPGIWSVRYAVRENTLRPGRISDEDVQREIEDSGRGWVVEHAGRVLGFAIGNRESGNLWALFVHPDAQGLGIGARLHACLLDWFATQPLERLWLDTGTDTRARGFYARRGWQVAGPHGEHEVRMERVNARPAR